MIDIYLLVLVISPMYTYIKINFHVTIKSGMLIQGNYIQQNLVTKLS